MSIRWTSSDYDGAQVTVTAPLSHGAYGGRRWTTTVELSCVQVTVPAPPFRGAYGGPRRNRRSQLEEVVTGYNVYWGGRPKAERRDAVVTFAIRRNIVGCRPFFLQGIKDRLMRLQLPIRGHKFANIISVYAPQVISGNVGVD
ncbi:unnamed protein product [Schistocephalus solidus]|uniref:F5/8 type C domain-containing protein n=1 Tax=Schistocephalus solidus TaxID=70667 RepID=A0A183TL37_SCHSO|nr:unnamed protein product [Schistocephalus solidus]